MTTRKPKLRFLSALLAVAMLMTLLPTAAFAQDSVYPAITGPALGSANNLDENVYYILDTDGIPKTDGASSEKYNVYYHDGTITLNNAVMKTPLYIPGGTTIKFLGTNSSGSADNKVSTAIQTMTAGNLTITGTGSYVAYADTGDGIIIPNGTAGNIYVTGGTLKLDNVKTSLKADDIEISGAADVTAYNISASKNLTIQGNANVVANKLDASEKINITGDSTVNVTGVGIYGSKGIDVTGNALVEVSSTSVPLNAFYGPININSTKKLVAKTTIANGAAITAGVRKSENRTDVTINSEVEVEGFVGIAANGKESKVIIDGGKVTATSAFIGLYTQSNSTAGTVEIKNNAEVHVVGKGNQTPAIATFSGNPQPINIENSTVSVSNCGFGFSGSQINLTNSTVTADASVCAFLATPTLTYTNGAKIQAGASSAETVEYNDITATADNYKEKYVKIEPGAPKYDIDLPDQSDVTVEVDGSTADETQEGKKVTLKGTSDDAVYSYVYTDANNEKIETPLTDANKDNDGNYTFTMPKGGVTIRQYNNLHITDEGEPFTTGTYTETADGATTYYGNGWQFNGETLTITADQDLTKEANPVEVPVKVEKGAVKGGIFGNDVTVETGADLDDAVVYGELTGNNKDKTHLLTTDPKNCTVVPEGYTGGVSVQSVARTPALKYTGKVYVVGDRTLTVAWPEGTTKMHWTATDGEGNPVELAKDSFDSETKILTVDMSQYSVLNLILAADPKNDLHEDDFDFADGKLTLKNTIKGAGEPSVVYRKVNGDTLGDKKLTSLKDAETGLYQLEVSVTEGDDYNAATLTSTSWRIYVSAKLTPGEKIVYKITVKNGTTDGIVEAQKGDLIKLFANEAPEGEEFDYWTVNGEKIDGDSFEMPAEDVTAVAVYKAKTYSIVFVTAHDTAPNSLTVKHGETISGDRILKADGYEFGGWYNGNEKFVFGENGTKVTSNLTLTAKWTEVKKPDPTPEEPDKPSTPDTPNKPDQPSEPEKPDTPNTPDQPSEPEEPKPVTYTIVIDNGTAYLDDGATAINTAEEGQTVTIKVNPEAITEGFEFNKWEIVSGEVKLADETASETTFEMPASNVELKATVKAVEVPAAPAAINPASVVAGTVVLGVGAASVGWSAYNIATELYLKWVLPQGIIPTTRGQLALLLWDKDDPTPVDNSVVYSDIAPEDTDLQDAARWVIAAGKMELLDDEKPDVFDPDAPVDIFAVAKAWRRK